MGFPNSGITYKLTCERSSPCLFQWVNGLKVDPVNHTLLIIVDTGVNIVDYIVSTVTFYLA